MLPLCASVDCLTIPGAGRACDAEEGVRTPIAALDMRVSVILARCARRASAGSSFRRSSRRQGAARPRFKPNPPVYEIKSCQNNDMAIVGRSNFRPLLQVLRAVAVLLVVAYHLNPSAVPAGFIGVDVFFVLSGFLITRLLLLEYSTSGSICLSAFYVRRLKRLLPALAVMLILTLLAGFALLSPSDFSSLARSAPYAAAWVSNFYFSFRSVGYFDELSQQDIFLHTWSLSVEEQFYLLWPATLLILLRLAVGSSRLSARQLVLWGIVAVSTVSLAFSIGWTQQWPNFSFYMLPSRIWQFGLGGISFLLARRVYESEKQPLAAAGLKLCGLVTIFLAAFLIPHDGVYPGAWSIFPTLGAGAFILGDQIGRKSAGNGLFIAPLVWIGDRSYSIYLWHFPTIILARIIFPEQPVGGIVFPVLLTFGLAHLTYHWIELPFWKGRFSQIPSRPAFLTAALTSLVAVATAVHLSSPISISESNSDPQIAWRMDLPELYRYNCDTWYSSAELVPCIFGQPNIDPKMATVVLGDSIGLQWFSLFHSLYARSDHTLIVLTKSACPIVDEPIFYERIKSRYEICEEWREKALRWIEEFRPSGLIIGSAASYDFDHEQWRAGTSRIVERLSQAADEIRVLVGTPRLSFDGPSCVARHVDADGQIDRRNCDSSADWGEIERVRQAVEEALREIEDAEVVDFSEIVCPERVCNAITEDGIVVFRDSQHLRDSFVRSRMEALSALLDLP